MSSGKSSPPPSTAHILKEVNEIISSKFGENGVTMFYVSFFILLAIIISLFIYVCYRCTCKSRADTKKVGYSQVYMQDSDTSEHSSSNKA